MNIVDNFTDAWWDMRKIDYAREKLLNKEHREVRHEMIQQEIQEGKKTIQEVADEFGVHKTTAFRIMKGKGLNK